MAGGAVVAGADTTALEASPCKKPEEATPNHDGQAFQLSVPAFPCWGGTSFVSFVSFVRQAPLRVMWAAIRQVYIC